MPISSQEGSSPEAASRGTRLDGWKEIASYLGRGERTVKRWETHRGLPTHRLPGAGRATVYAFSSELDEWLLSRRAQGEDVVEEDEERSNPAPDKESLAAVETVPPLAALPSPQPSASNPGHEPSGVVAAIPRGIDQGRKKTLAGALAIGLAGVAIYAAVLHPAHGTVRQRILALLGRTGPDAGRPSPGVLSDSEKAEAHNLYLQGRYQWNQRTPESLNRALDDFVQSVVHDPGYAPAYAGMADTYDLLREYSTMPESDAFPRAIAAAKKAVELDDALPEAHRALAFAEFYGTWDFADAEKEFRRAIELNPRDPVARRWYANAFALPGHYAQCLDQIDKAQELDPTSQATLADKGILLYKAGKRAEGIALLKEVERTDPEFLSPHFYLMIVSLEAHDYPAYLTEGQKTAEINNDPVLRDIFAAARTGYARAGEAGLLNELYARQKQYYQAGKLWGTMLAKTCVMMGKRQEALQLLEEAYARHEEYVLSCLTESDFLSLKDDPRYRALAKKINFPAAPANQ